MTLHDFIKVNGVSYYADTIDTELLKRAEKAVGVSFGTELVEYLFKYGYLAYEHMALYGMNMRQGLESEMVKQTCYLHQYYPVTNNLIAVENQGDGDYYLVNSNDDVFEYDTSLNEIQQTGMKLTAYILQRLENVKAMVSSDTNEKLDN